MKLLGGLSFLNFAILLFVAFQPLPAAAVTSGPLVMLRIPDGVDGLIVVWVDERAGSADIYAQRVDANGTAQWTSGGMPVAVSCDEQTRPAAAPDGVGGVFVSWSDGRDGVNVVVRAQHIDASGTPLWAEDGVVVADVGMDAFQSYITPDGLGGALVLFTARNYSRSEVFAQRLRPGGGRAWGTGGLSISSSGLDFNARGVTDEGAGIGVFAWENRDINPDRLQFTRRDSTGTELWSTLWSTTDYTVWSGEMLSGTAGGTYLTASNQYVPTAAVQLLDMAGNFPWGNPVPVFPAGWSQFELRLAPDALGGVYTACRADISTTQTDICGQHVDAGGARQWPGLGLLCARTPGPLADLQLSTNTDGNLYLAWADSRQPGEPRIYATRFQGGWGLPGIAVAEGDSGQVNPGLAVLPTGDVLVTWEDHRTGDRELYAQRLSGVGSRLLGDDGRAVEADPGLQRLPALTSDGDVLVGWVEKSGGSYAVFARKYTLGGAPVWPTVRLCSGPVMQSQPCMVSDGVGGAVVVWSERTGAVVNLRAQRVTSSGNLAVGWPAGGRWLAQLPEDQLDPVASEDGQGGVIVAWEAPGFQPTIRLQRVSSSGVAQWGFNGVTYPAANSPAITPAIASDGAGGAIVAAAIGGWIYAQRFDSTGATMWPNLGVTLGSDYPSYSPVMAADGFGGAIVVWHDSRHALPGNPMDLYAQRVTADGELLWSGGEGASVVCGAGFRQQLPAIVADGTGGAIVAWEDERSRPFFNPASAAEGYKDIYAQRIDAFGDPQWSGELPVCIEPHGQFAPVIDSDGAGGAIIAWADMRGGGDPDLYAQRITADGVYAWTDGGVTVCAVTGAAWRPAIAHDGAGGAFLAWQDRREGLYDLVYGTHLTATGTPGAGWDQDGVAPVLISVIGAQMSAVGVHIEWRVAGLNTSAVASPGTVWRRSENSNWCELGAASLSTTGEVVFDDKAPPWGERVGYCLEVVCEYGSIRAGETWIPVPTSTALSIARVQTNPTGTDVKLAVTLPRWGSARLEVFDLRGRRCWSRELGNLGPGPHIVSVDLSDRIASGIHTARLSQDSNVATIKFTLVR